MGRRRRWYWSLSVSLRIAAGRPPAAARLRLGSSKAEPPLVSSDAPAAPEPSPSAATLRPWRCPRPARCCSALVRRAPRKRPQRRRGEGAHGDHAAPERAREGAQWRTVSRAAGWLLPRRRASGQLTCRRARRASSSPWRLALAPARALRKPQGDRSHDAALALRPWLAPDPIPVVRLLVRLRPRRFRSASSSPASSWSGFVLIRLRLRPRSSGFVLAGFVLAGFFLVGLVLIRLLVLRFVLVRLSSPASSSSGFVARASSSRVRLRFRAQKRPAK